jgi:hypothetical protein
VEEGVTASEAWSRRLAGGWFFWPVSAAAMGLVALALVGPELGRHAAVTVQRDALRTEVAALEETVQDLEAIRDALQNDPAYTEQVVRHELGLVRAGEVRLPMPVDLKRHPEAPPLPRPGGGLVPAVLARLASPSARLTAILAGGAILGAAVLLSVPSRPKPASP